MMDKFQELRQCQLDLTDIVLDIANAPSPRPGGGAPLTEHVDQTPAVRMLQRRVAQIEHKYIPDMSNQIERIEGLANWVYCTVSTPGCAVRREPTLEADIVVTLAQGGTVLGSHNLKEGIDGLWMQIRLPGHPMAPLWVLAEESETDTSNLHNYRLVP